MATSGTFNFAWSFVDFLEQAHMRAGVDYDRVEARDVRFVIREINSLFADWANQGPNLWAIDLQTVSLTSGQVTFNAPASTVDLLEAVLRRDGIDYIITRFSREDYMNLPEKNQTGRPTNFWVDKTLPQYTVYLWPLTDLSTDQIRYYRMIQLQDVNGTGSETFNAPYLFSDALCAGIAFRIGQRQLMLPGTAMTETKLAVLESQYKQSYFNAVQMNNDKVPLTLGIQNDDYYRFG